jgi:hypothetical protein
VSSGRIAHCMSRDLLLQAWEDRAGYLLCAIGVRRCRCVNCDALVYRLKHSDGSESQDIKAANEPVLQSLGNNPDHAQC